MNIDPQHTNLVMTCAPFAPDTLTNDMHEVYRVTCQNNTCIISAIVQVVYEEYGFDSLCVRPSPWFSAYEFAATHSATDCCIIVDSGFSFTHVMPFVDLKCIPTAVRTFSVVVEHLMIHRQSA